MVTVTFNKDKSYVVKGKETDALGKREKLHLKIAEYLAGKAKANLPALVGKGTATNADKATGIQQAKDKAAADLKTQMDAYGNKWGEIAKAYQEAYNKDTDHSHNAQGQADWESNWQKKGDAIIQTYGWK
ncbi:MAG: hypothetical protein C4297_12570 [Gemmataceae bacterium]